MEDLVVVVVSISSIFSLNRTQGEGVNERKERMGRKE